MSFNTPIFFFHLIVLALFLNAIRFNLSNKLNKILILMFGIYFYSLSIIYFQEWILPLSLFILFLAVFFYQYLGLFVAFPVTSTTYFFVNGFTYYDFILFILLTLLIAFAGFRCMFYINKQKRWKSLLIKNSKQLNIIREISLAMQQTRDLDKILHIIITSVTAGHGLGFNRAIVFLHDKNNNQLTGMMGIGPLDEKEGIDNWRNISEQKYSFIDLLENIEKEEIDPELNQMIRHLTIDLDSNHILKDALVSGKHRIVRRDKIHDQIHQLLINLFNYDEFLIIPMIYQYEKIGLLIVDNPVSKKTIIEQEIDNIMPLASLASVAIQQAQLYQEIEELTLRDGLTSLYNQRALQNTLQKHFDSNQTDSLAMIMLDIDYFKHYNDTNGHLLGNEVLEQLANIIKQSIRESDLAFRFGGEEFSVLLFNTSDRDVRKVAEQIRKNIETNEFPNESTQPGNKITITVGYAMTDQISQPTPSRLTIAADQALYYGKESGKNCVYSYADISNIQLK